MKSEQSGKILVVDDDNDVLYTARLVLKRFFKKVDTINKPCLIPESLAACKYDVVLLDMNYERGVTTGEEGLKWLRKILQADPLTIVLTTTAYGEINLAVQAMKIGAADFLIKPWNSDHLVEAVRNGMNLRQMRKERKNITQAGAGISGNSKYPEIISQSAVMIHLREIIETVAPTDANILIMGENGTGKELVAWALHSGSKRRQNPFVHVDLGAIPETLFESELFGHTRGAFTDAREERAGRFEAASGGTIFLDEIGNLSLPLQAKILTAIQKREVIRLGSNLSIPVNVRLISATNMPLYEMADSFEFRQDLLYRINTVELIVPPLRERKEDISLIADYYIKIFSEQYSNHGITIREDTIQKLKDYHWPGNIRELAHAIERAVILCRGCILTPDDFAFKARPTQLIPLNEPPVRVEDYEKLAVSSALSKYNGNLSKAAEELGMARTTLYRKIARFGME
jgi:DNA-binding NtrC family response regulator